MAVPFSIGALNLANRIVQAPLAGITNLPFRLLAKEAGCGLVCSEMVSANGLVYRSKNTLQMLDSVFREKPVSVQIFGADPDVMAEAAAIVAERGADILDINLGCSVKKVLKTGSGSALMREPERTRRILTKVRQALSIPLTIKIRSGWEPSGAQALLISQIAEDCGVDAVVVHPRTVSQGFRGRSDWRVIRRVKSSVSIPVIGNGDVETPEDGLRMMAETGCDAVMIGRAAIGNPWIFSQLLALMENRPQPRVGLAERREAMVRYVEDSVRYFGESIACRMMRSRLGWFVKGLPHNSRFREVIKQVSTEKEALAGVETYLTDLNAAIEPITP